MAERFITGFHAVEERVLKAKSSRKSADGNRTKDANRMAEKKRVMDAARTTDENGAAHESRTKDAARTQKKNAGEKHLEADGSGLCIFYSKAGPRVKKILEAAKESGIPFCQTDDKNLDAMVRQLPETSRDHRGIVLRVEGESNRTSNTVDFDEWILASKSKDENERQTVIILDSVTDPHNVGAIIRSSDQFGASLVVIPDHRGTKDIENNEVIARSSAGSSAWVPVCQVTNLVRTVQILKENGFWVFGADAGGESLANLKFSTKSAIVMGSEGSGMARLLSQQCDTIVSIPTCGKIDSLNVSVAAGVLLYEVYRQSL